MERSTAITIGKKHHVGCIIRSKRRDSNDVYGCKKNLLLISLHGTRVTRGTSVATFHSLQVLHLNAHTSSMDCVGASFIIVSQSLTTQMLLVSSLHAASRQFSEPGAFVQLSSLNNIAKNCIPITNHQHISWNQDSNFSSLTILSVGVTHALTSHHSNCICEGVVLEFTTAVLDAYDVPDLSIQRFKTIKDSPTSKHAGEGLVWLWYCSIRNCFRVVA
jgi:hypothetical protein